MNQTIAFSLIDLVESRAEDLQTQASSLKGTITMAIGSYDGLSLTKRSGGATIDAVRPAARVFVA